MNVGEYITENRKLPHPDLEASWGSIVASDEVKARLLNQAILALRLRSELPFDVTSLHGMILLYGPPGTGKTTLARGVAQELAPLAGGTARLIEINPHGIMSADHGQSQQRVFELLCDHIPLLADDNTPTVVLLDEVESMAVARSEASLAANPADVHRATDAVLMALDRNAREHPNIIFVATSNFTTALDEAFRSRADLALEIPLPDEVALRAILERTLTDFGKAYPKLAMISQDPHLGQVARELVGLDGRRIRKVVTEALAGNRRTVLDPNSLETSDLLQIARRLKVARQQEVRRAAA
ncbi:MAG TPA: AAA family ATPase [Thermoleophilaceae bacterium]|jgi:SpoVK/Ycf46/Vps4 family AAA+-type ATPase